MELRKRRPRIEGDRSDEKKQVRPVSTPRPTCVKDSRTKRRSEEVSTSAHRRPDDLYRAWKAQLEAGFNVLIHGIGSKRKLLERFLDTFEDAGAVTIRGYSSVPLTGRHVIAAAYAALRRAEVDELCHRSVEDMMRYIRDLEGHQLLVVVHGLDGTATRPREVQLALGELAKCSVVRLIASVDHVNCAILWDEREASSFNWVWHMVPTWELHTEASGCLPPLLGKNADETVLQGASLVLKSLTSNSRGIFRVLAEEQISKQGALQGIPLAQFYYMCRERFLVSSELTLRTHLTEFKDHELMKTKRSGDGQEMLFIPFSKERIEKLLQDMT